MNVGQVVELKGTPCSNADIYATFEVIPMDCSLKGWGQVDFLETGGFLVTVH